MLHETSPGLPEDIDVQNALPSRMLGADYGHRFGDCGCCDAVSYEHSDFGRPGLARAREAVAAYRYRTAFRVRRLARTRLVGGRQWGDG